MADNEKKPTGLHAYDYPTLLSYRIVVLANLLTKGAARLYSQRFGIQLSEWRLLAAVATNAPAGAMHMAQSLGADKGWVSRTLASLARRGLVVYAKDLADSRRMNIALTSAGRRLYKRVLPTALQRQRTLFAGFTKADEQIFRVLLERLHRRAETALVALPIRPPSSSNVSRRRSSAGAAAREGASLRRSTGRRTVAGRQMKSKIANL